MSVDVKRTNHFRAGFEPSRFLKFEEFRHGADGGEGAGEIEVGWGFCGGSGAAWGGDGGGETVEKLFQGVLRGGRDHFEGSMAIVF